MLCNPMRADGPQFGAVNGMPREDDGDHHAGNHCYSYSDPEHVRTPSLVLTLSVLLRAGFAITISGFIMQAVPFDCAWQPVAVVQHRPTQGRAIAADDSADKGVPATLEVGVMKRTP